MSPQRITSDSAATLPERPCYTEHFSSFQLIVFAFMTCSLTGSLSLIAPINPVSSSSSSRQLSSLQKVYTPPAQLPVWRRYGWYQCWYFLSLPILVSTHIDTTHNLLQKIKTWHEKMCEHFAEMKDCGFLPAVWKMNDNRQYKWVIAGFQDRTKFSFSLPSSQLNQVDSSVVEGCKSLTTHLKTARWHFTSSSGGERVELGCLASATRWWSCSCWLTLIREHKLEMLKNGANCILSQ